MNYILNKFKIMSLKRVNKYYPEGEKSEQDYYSCENQCPICGSVNISHGKMCFTGTRIMVSTVLDNLAEGMSFDEIMQDFDINNYGINSTFSALTKLEFSPYTGEASVVKKVG